MHGRRLATTEEVVCIASPDSGEALDRVDSWATTHGIDLTVREVGEPVADDDYSEPRETLGVAIGGDGTFLEGVRSFAPRRIPMLGINTGTLAFLTRVTPDRVDAALTEVLRGRATIEDRQQLRARTDDLDATGVNDVMIQPVPPDDPVERKITQLHLFAGREYVGRYGGSGLAVATPTGSTGISLSAGGPVHDPRNNLALQVTPLHTHRMGVRPVVLNSDVELTVVPEDPVQVFVDGGRHFVEVDADEPIQVGGAEEPAHVVRTSYDADFFTAISAKLGWSLRTADDDGPTHRLPTEEPASDDLYERARQVAVEAARGAGEPLRELHGQVENVQYKSDKADIVTEADYQAEHIIATVIENEFPNHAIRSEEDVHRTGDSAYTWLLDPLDGTGNFAHGNPNYSISIALLEDGRPVVGVVYSPEPGELFAAIEGRGATADGAAATTTGRDSLDESMLLSGYDPDGGFLQTFYQQTRGVRRIGSAALNLCYVATGSADALWEYDTYPWDVAAGLVIAREAGATVTDADGRPYELVLDDDERRTPLLASNGPLHDSLLATLEETNLRKGADAAAAEED
jgi:myo-inositol-1(or 4)-monophosphatase